MKKLSGSIELTKLTHARVTLNGKSGPVRGTFIPDSHDSLTVKDERVYLGINIVDREEKDDYGNTGFVSQFTRNWKELKEAGTPLPVLGNIRPLEAQSEPAHQMDVTVPPNGGPNDLPF